MGRAKTVKQLALAQLNGGVPWGETLVGASTICVCQHCEREFHVDSSCDPCAFCDRCTEQVLDKLAAGVIRFAPTVSTARGKSVTPPTWRALAARARRLGLRIPRSRHQASICRGAEVLFGLATWLGRRHDPIILRTAVAAALEQLEARR